MASVRVVGFAVWCFAAVVAEALSRLTARSAEEEHFADDVGQPLRPHVSPGSCIGADLCVPAKTQRLPQLVKPLAVQEAPPRTIFEERTLVRGCTAKFGALDKTILLPIVPYYHGGSALEAVLMSSSKVATICKAGTWQCTATFSSSAPAVSSNLLLSLSKYWDMDRPVLMEKGPRGNFTKVFKEYNQLRNESVSGTVRDLEQQQAYNFQFAYVVMWRPVCLSILSSSALDAHRNKTQFALDELAWMEELVVAHKWLKSRGLPSLVINFGDLLWQRFHTKNRLQKFLPCIGELEYHWKPLPNKDVFPGNGWRADMSVLDLGKGLDPADCCSYDVANGVCSEESDFFKALPDEAHVVRLRSAQDYLKSHS